MFLKFLLSLLFYVNSILALNEQPILFITIPKSGTHLLQKCLMLLTKKEVSRDMLPDKPIEGNFDFDFQKIEALKNNFIFHNHLMYSLEASQAIQKNNFISFFMSRDPRDQMVSLVYWTYKIPEFPQYKTMEFKELLMKYITEGPHVWFDYLSYIDWFKHTNICNIKFENLIGAKGGGSLIQQISEIRKITNHLELEISNKEILEIATNIWGDSFTFRSGKIGAWKTHFTLDHKEAFKKKFG